VLDPYRRERLRPADGPLMDRLLDRRKPDAKTIFVYLSRGVQPPPHVMAALLPHAPLLHVHAPSLAAQDAQALVDHGAKLFETPQPFETELSNHRLIIHYGVAGTSAAALLAGVPQLALSLDIEKDMVGQALESLGVGRLVKIHDPAARVTPEMIGDLADDRSVAACAGHVAEAQRREFNPDPLAPFIDACVKLAA
jgi:hypothetical protein